MNDSRDVTAATCLGCGCACDDIDVTVRDGRIVEATRACALGVEWFGDGRAPSRVLVDGADASMATAGDRVVQLLSGAHRPLVLLAPDLSCEAQREAVALADHLHATLDTVTSLTAASSILAFQESGRSSATFGEVRHRTDVVVFCGVDPSQRYPRYVERVIPAAAVRVRVEQGDEAAVLTAAGALVAGVSAATGAGPVWDAARALASALDGARYVTVVADAEPQDDGRVRDAGVVAALISFVNALNGRARAALSTLRGGGNRVGADAVLTSQTGFPMAVDFSRGTPRYRPFDGNAAARLDRGEIDAVLVIGSASHLPAEVVARVRSVSHAVIGPRASDGPLSKGACVIDVGVPGIHETGTAMRMDDVPLPLRAIVDGPPNAVEVLRSLVRRVLVTNSPGASPTF